MDVRNATRRIGLVAVVLVLASLPGCANYIGTTAGSFMRVIREDADPNKRYLAYRKLSDPYCFANDEQKARATALLVERLARGDEPVATRAVICRTLGEIGRPEARDALVARIEDSEPIVRAEAARALGRVGTPEDAILLTRLLATDSEPDCRLASIEALGAMTTPDPRAYLVLVEGMEDEDPAIRLASWRALCSSTGQNLGITPEPWRDFARQRVAGADGSTSSVER